MSRNHNLLIVSFISIALVMLVGCFKEEEHFSDYYPTLEEAVGRYYFVPEKEEVGRDDYKYFNLKKGDTLFLEIKKDSTYVFNKFYYGREVNHNFYGKSGLKNNVTGKVIKNKENGGVFPRLNVKELFISFQGFKKSDKTGAVSYYYTINSPTDASEYEYYIFYKKMK